MIRVSQALLEAVRKAQRNGGAVGSIYLTTAHTDLLLEEMGTKRDLRMTRRPPVDRFEGLPVYPDKQISMVVCSDQAGEAYTVFI